MSHGLQQRLRSQWHTFTVSEQKIATYLLQNLDTVPFESGATLSKHADVSPMTVGRFFRKIGLGGIKDMKDELQRDESWTRLYRRPIRLGDIGLYAKDAHAELNTLSKVYKLSHSATWQPIVHCLATSERVSVASFELTQFLGTGLATLLQYVRPHVSFASGTDGAYSRILIDSDQRDCVVLIDERRYSRRFRVLAEQVSARNIPLIIITDTLCYWAHELTPNVLMVPANNARMWHSFAVYNILFSMLINGVIDERHDVVFDRIKLINDLRHTFDAFSDPE